MPIDEEMSQLIQEDGGLFNLGWYLAWTIGDSKATLDGDFTAAQLRWIADYMDKHPCPTST